MFPPFLFPSIWAGGKLNPAHPNILRLKQQLSHLLKFTAEQDHKWKLLTKYILISTSRYLCRYNTLCLTTKISKE